VTVAEVRAHFEEMFPDPEVRVECEKVLARLVEAAAASGPSRWVITLTSRPQVTLSVGRAYVARFIEGQLSVPVIASALTDGERRALEPISTVEDEGFSVIEGALTYVVGEEHIAAATTLLERASRQFISAAAETAKQTPWARKHSPALVEYLEHATGRTLPRPVYEVSDFEALGFVRVPVSPRAKRGAASTL